MTPEQRSVWDDCLDLAESIPLTGTLCVAPKVLYTIEQLAAIFNTPEPVVRDALKEFRHLGMLDEVGRIVNWKKYQSEYERVKAWRHSKRNKK